MVCVFKTPGSSKEEEEMDRLFKQSQVTIPGLFNQITLFDNPSSLPKIISALYQKEDFTSYENFRNQPCEQLTIFRKQKITFFLVY